MTPRGRDPLRDRPQLSLRLRQAIVDVPDFPKEGILFKDITPVLHDPALFGAATAALAELFRDAEVTHVLAIESRGFMFGAPIALELGVPFVPVRKPGKLPREVVQERYALEYGEDALELHRDAVPPGGRGLI